MKNTKFLKIALVAVFSFMLTFALVGCGGDGGSSSGTDSSAVSSGASSGSSSGSSSSTSTTDWEKWLDEYDAWADSYVAFVDKYVADPTDTSLIAEANEMNTEISEWASGSTDMLSDLSADDLTDFNERYEKINEKIYDAMDKLTAAAS